MPVTSRCDICQSTYATTYGEHVILRRHRRAVGRLAKKPEVQAAVRQWAASFGTPRIVKP